MIVFLNGAFVPEEQAKVSVFDRSFLYGDGLFETMRVYNRKPFRWDQHLKRLTRGAEFLGITLPFKPQELRDFLDELLAKNQMPAAIIRIMLSRGVGVRGYSPAGANRPLLVMSAHEGPGPDPATPPRWKLRTSSSRIPADEPLAQFKTCNKLPQVLARAEAEAAKAQEALLLNTKGFVVEAASSNLFWIRQETVFTPPIASGILAGVTRAIVLEICQGFGIPCREANLSGDELLQTDGIFLSLSSVGIAEAVALDEKPLRQSPLTQRLWAGYLRRIKEETD
jgi:branched-chain amino acid aminotransferase